MVSHLTELQSAWFRVEERHAEELDCLSEMSCACGPQVAFDVFLDHLPVDDPESLRRALHPIFQSALLVAHEIRDRREKRDRIAERHGRPGP
jgi:hypothetical protein